MDDIRKVLSEHPFFENLNPEHLDLLAGLASGMEYQAGDFLFREGEHSDLFYVLLKGRVALETFGLERGPIIITTLGEGEVMGWTWIVEPYIHRYDAHALEFTRVLAFNGSILRGECEKNNALGYELLKRFTHVMANRLESTRLQLIDIYGIPEDRRKPH